MFNKLYRHFFKRFFDIIFSFLALIVLSPVLLILAILVRIKLGSPVIFKQKRPGLNEKIFTLYKFRTMTDKKDEKGNLLPDSERLTSFGKWLRSTSLDELPELWNILKGKMSFVGPRPLLVEYLPYYTEKERLRHTIRPGITGLAQINGRNYLNWTERFSLDIKYLEKISVVTDFKILLKTISKVLHRESVASSGQNNTEIGFLDLNLERKLKRNGD
ncbi:MAG: sugar transferase [Bacteroidales bacterium]|nr:sugar transferase [Bacteroidales bacterium]